MIAFIISDIGQACQREKDHKVPAKLVKLYPLENKEGGE
jgi:hypothetical protein